VRHYNKWAGYRYYGVVGTLTMFSNDLAHLPTGWAGVWACSCWPWCPGRLRHLEGGQGKLARHRSREGTMMNDLTQPAVAWSLAQVEALFALPFNDLMFQAQSRASRGISTPTRCSFPPCCPSRPAAVPRTAATARSPPATTPAWSGRRLLDVAEVVDAARAAKDAGATRFCMGAAWRGPKDKDLDAVAEMVREVKALGLETCVTLGMLKPGQAEELKAAGLDYYNHNLDTAQRVLRPGHHHPHLHDRLDTLSQVRDAGIHVCCGGIVGMGESRRVRAGLIMELANLNPQPESVPINMLVKVPGTPMAISWADDLDPLEFVRTIAVARITMPASHVRLSAGRRELGEAVQALCFLAGANSMFYGDRLLTTGNPDVDADEALFAKLGLKGEGVQGRRCAGH
jgi:biotin synthase